ncbi:helix-turn-helix domain-containing protein [Metasolibacillus fluoroglycofenilyticus]|uniref:helix-turn-helix domain-containing protein n=1 Tax=Metasolibacillus fluoroglycofenilyticus TaxID=1239396 RepID=UPI0022864E65|nr:helix-turn-helix transcriptional regulator [Metasolibacillus fluoroglycofenilyticus]
MIIINNRIKLLRKVLKLSQEDFGRKLGITKTAISKIETGRNNLTDSTIKLLCTNFNVNEVWLRTGKGEMFIETATFSLDEQARIHNLSALDLDIVKRYMELDPYVREEIIKFIGETYLQHTNKETTATTDNDSHSKTRESGSGYYEDQKLYVNKVAETVVSGYGDADAEIEAELARYRIELEAEKKAQQSLALQEQKKSN